MTTGYDFPLLDFLLEILVSPETHLCTTSLCMYSMVSMFKHYAILNQVHMLL